MTGVPPTSPGAEEGRLAPGPATRILQLGLDEPIRPIDHLLDRLSRPDGSDWLVGALARSPASMFGPSQHFLADGQASIDQLQSIKHRSKQLLAESKDLQSCLCATLGYFFSIAAALAHYQKVITSRSREEFLPVLEDLAAVAPEPWSAMFHRAGVSLSSHVG